MTTFEELKSDLNEKNRELKSVYGKQFPSLPLVLKRRNRTELNSGHTQSVLMGYNARVFNFLEARRIVKAFNQFSKCVTPRVQDGDGD